MKLSIRALAIVALLTAPPAFGAGGHVSGMGAMSGGIHSSLGAPTASHAAGVAPMAAAPNTQSGKAVGQPNVTCQNNPGYPGVTPGNSYGAPGSAFNPDGASGSVYAGSQAQNSRNSASVAQYDVACYRP